MLRNAATIHGMQRVLFGIIVMVLCGGSLGGCSTAVIAAAGATAGFGLAQGQAEAFITGELKAARVVSIEMAERAVFEAMDELYVPITTHKKKPHEVHIVARAEGGHELRITLKFISPVSTKFEIRVGLLGDQATSRLVLARIDSKLGIEQPVIPVEVSPIVAPPLPPTLEPDVKIDDAEPVSNKPKSIPPAEPPP